MSDEYLNYSSYFIKNKALFGSYPQQNQVDDLIKKGVVYFIDLTMPGEVFPTYNTNNKKYLNYPILDRKAPVDNFSFASLILELKNIIENLKNNEKIYIHCRGGHGRAGIVVACLLYMFHENISTMDSILLTTKYHNDRKVMREKWRQIGSPQTKLQKAFIHKFFGNMIFFRAYKRGPTHGFSNYSFHNITVPENDLGIIPGKYPSSESIFQSSKIIDSDYSNKQKLSKNPRISKKLGDKIEPREFWNENKCKIMRYIIQLKIEQHTDIRKNLLNTSMKDIIFNSKQDEIFGTGIDNQGQNMLGKILMSIRNDIYKTQKPNFIYKKENTNIKI